MSIFQNSFRGPIKVWSQASNLLLESCSFFSGGLASYFSTPLISTYFTLLRTSLNYYFFTSTSGTSFFSSHIFHLLVIFLRCEDKIGFLSSLLLLSSPSSSRLMTLLLINRFSKGFISLAYVLSPHLSIVNSAHACS